MAPTPDPADGGREERSSPTGEDAAKAGELPAGEREPGRESAEEVATTRGDRRLECGGTPTERGRTGAGEAEADATTGDTTGAGATTEEDVSGAAAPGAETKR